MDDNKTAVPHLPTTARIRVYLCVDCIGAKTVQCRAIERGRRIFLLHPKVEAFPEPKDPSPANDARGGEQGRYKYARGWQVCNTEEILIANATTTGCQLFRRPA